MLSDIVVFMGNVKGDENTPECGEIEMEVLCWRVNDVQFWYAQYLSQFFWAKACFEVHYLGGVELWI